MGSIISTEIYISDIYKNGFKNLTFTAFSGGTIPTYTKTDSNLLFYAGSGKQANSNSIFQSNDNWECSFKVKSKTSSNFGLHVGLYSTNATQTNRAMIGFESREYYGAIKWNIMGSKNTTTRASQYDHTDLTDLSTHTVVFKRTDTNKLLVYIDGTLKRTFEDYTWLSDNLMLVIFSWSGDGSEYQEITDFKLKKL